MTAGPRLTAHAHVRARLLGLTILTLDADVVVLDDLELRSSTVEPPLTPVDRSWSARPARVTAPRASAVPRGERAVPGGELARAVELWQSGHQVLDGRTAAIPR